MGEGMFAKLKLVKINNERGHGPNKSLVLIPGLVINKLKVPGTNIYRVQPLFFLNWHSSMNSCTVTKYN